MGTDVCIKIICNEKNRNEAQKNFIDLRRFYFDKEKIFSRFDGESELSKLNRNLGRHIEASHDIIEVAQKALYYYKLTGGFFDPRIIEILENIGYRKDFKSNHPGVYITAIKDIKADLKGDLEIEKNKLLFNHRLDFSGIAKGYITDRAAEFLKSRGFRNFLIDSGGDIYASGTDETNKPWLISIEGADENKLNFNLSDRGVATSGITRRKWEVAGKKYHHLINPKNPEKFSFDLKSVTVISENTEKADIWAKTLYLMGREEGIKYSNENSIASFFLIYKGNVYLSKEIKKYIYSPSVLRTSLFTKGRK